MQHWPSCLTQFYSSFHFALITISAYRLRFLNTPNAFNRNGKNSLGNHMNDDERRRTTTTTNDDVANQRFVWYFLIVTLSHVVPVKLRWVVLGYTLRPLHLRTCFKFCAVTEWPRVQRELWTVQVILCVSSFNSRPRLRESWVPSRNHFQHSPAPVTLWKTKARDLIYHFYWTFLFFS